MTAKLQNPSSADNVQEQQAKELARHARQRNIRKFRQSPDGKAYTSPRALRRLLESRLEVLPQDAGSPQEAHTHALMRVERQCSDEDSTSFISCVCTLCLRHFHITSYGKNSRAPNEKHPMHMLIVDEQKSKPELEASRSSPHDNSTGFVRFTCAVDGCLFALEIFEAPSRLGLKEFRDLQDPGRTLRNLNEARAEDPARYRDVEDSYGNNAPGTLYQYITDGLARKGGNGHDRIKKRNKKFRVTISNDFDSLLRPLGFQDGPTDAEEPYWVIPQLESFKDATPVGSLRAMHEDLQAELVILMDNPEIKLRPAWADLVRAFGGEYRVASDVYHLEQAKEEDLALIGCLVEFPPSIFSWAAILLATIAPSRRDDFTEAARRAIGQRDHEAALRLVMFTSNFDAKGEPDYELEDAFRRFDSSPNASHDEDYYLSKYYVRIEADTTDEAKVRAYQDLELIGKHIGKDMLSKIASMSEVDLGPPAVKTTRRMSIRSAAAILKVDASYPADMIRDFVPNVDASIDREKVVEAIEVLAELKRQQDQPKEAELLQETARFVNEAAGKEIPTIPTTTEPDLSAINPDYMSTPPGLRNIGNTCYLNSILQYFYNVKVVRELALNYDLHKLDLTEAAVKNRRVGGGGLQFTLEQAIIAHQFVEMLRHLFLELQGTTEVAVQPLQKLANTAMKKTEDILKVELSQDKSQDEPPPLPARHPPAPPYSAEALPEDTEMSNGNTSTNQDQVEVTSLESSQTLVNDGDTPPSDESYVQVTHGDSTDDATKVVAAAGKTVVSEVTEITKPTESGEDTAMKDVAQELTLEEKMTRISHQCEYSTRSGTTQEDVEEIMGQILEHLMRAIRPDGSAEGSSGLQQDIITKNFFTITVNYTLTEPKPKTPTLIDIPTQRSENDESSANGVEVVPERYITAFPHPDTKNKVPSTLFEALDRSVDYELMDGRTTARYTVFRSLPPILHVFIQRTAGTKNKNPVIIPEVLYMDRYMDTQEGTDLWKARWRTWIIKSRLGELRSRDFHDEAFLPRREKPREIQSNNPYYSSVNGWGKDADNGFESRPVTRLDDLLGGLEDIGPAPKSAVAATADQAESVVEKPKENSPDDSTTISNMLDTLAGITKDLAASTEAELRQYLAEEEAAFAELKNEKYRLHAVICHGGEAHAGHYWVWVRDFRKNVWLKYNDSIVTEEAGSSDEVLAKLNSTGDPYYVAYVRDELKDTLVDVPQRSIPVGGFPVQDIEMIDGIIPDELQATVSAKLADADEVQEVLPDRVDAA